MNAPGIVTTGRENKVVQQFTAATAPRAAEYGIGTASIDGALWYSLGVSNDSFPSGWVSRAIPSFTASTLPSAVAYGEGPAWVDDQLWFSNGSIWSLRASRQLTQPIVGQIGDSITANSATRGSWIYLGDSIVMHGARQSNFAFLAGPVQGTGGYTAAQLLADMSTYAPLTDPWTTHVLVLIGTNDSFTPTPTSTFINTLKQIYDKIYAVGKTPIAAMIPPRTTSTSTIIKAIIDYNNAIARLAASYGIPCADFYTPCVEYTGTAIGSMAWKANFTRTGDAVHPAYLGCQAMGGALAKAMLPILGGSAAQVIPNFSSPYQHTTADGYPYANNLFQTLASGTINTSGSTPAAPWNASISNSPTSTVFDLAHDPGCGAYGQSNIWQLVLNSANDQSTVQTTSQPMTNFASPGDLIAMWFNFKFTPAVGQTDGTAEFTITVRDAGNLSDRFLGFSQNTAGVAATVQPDSGRVVLVRTVPAGFSGNLCWYITQQQSAAFDNQTLCLSNTGAVNLSRLGAAF